MDEKRATSLSGDIVTTGFEASSFSSLPKRFSESAHGILKHTLCEVKETLVEKAKDEIKEAGAETGIPQSFSSGTAFPSGNALNQRDATTGMMPLELAHPLTANPEQMLKLDAPSDKVATEQMGTMFADNYGVGKVAKQVLPMPSMPMPSMPMPSMPMPSMPMPSMPMPTMSMPSTSMPTMPSVANMPMPAMPSVANMPSMPSTSGFITPQAFSNPAAQMPGAMQTLSFEPAPSQFGGSYMQSVAQTFDTTTGYKAPGIR